MVPPTDRPFTVIVCTGCPTGPGDPPPAAVLDELRDPVRTCPQGMLVSVGCLLGEAVCTARSDLGVMAAVQPCTPDRTPVGVARILGPLRGALCAIRLLDWVTSPPFDPFGSVVQ